MAGILSSSLRRRHHHASLKTLICRHLHQPQQLPPPPPPPQSSSPEKERKDRWHVLPPFSSSSTVPSSIGKDLLSKKAEEREMASTGATTAFRWVRRCCPGVPANLVQKLFRIRKVKRKVGGKTDDIESVAHQDCSVKRVSAKHELIDGDVILLPASVNIHSPAKDLYHCNDDEITFVQSLEIHKDTDIVVLNKPHGMPVQGGIGIKSSIDILAARALKYDYKESPRLVHRLDRDSSGILVLARTQTSAAILHSIFREKTFGASNEIDKARRILQRKYWALVIGKPKRSSGKISAPLSKVVIENGKSEHVTVSVADSSAQVAITEFKVIGSYENGLTWLELCPLTGRKHQLRVHCSEVLGTPIVGDYKYGWQAHRKWEAASFSTPDIDYKKLSTHQLPFGLDLSGGSISDKKPHLHLHCRQMVLPNISEIIKYLQTTDRNHDFSKIESLNLVAPLPSHMQRSWDILKLKPLN